jgi:hypothetical protein
MLVKDPGQRITMPGIMSHAWFTKDMPAGINILETQVDPAKAKQVRCCRLRAAMGLPGHRVARLQSSLPGMVPASWRRVGQACAGGMPAS